MEAISKGAHNIGGTSIGYTCKSFPSVVGNEFLTETIVTENIFERLNNLITNSELFIIQRGGTGTLAELFLCLDIIRKLKVKPRIIVVGGFWKDIFKECSYLIPQHEIALIEMVDNYNELKQII
jgi:predicted Rossmann-fold nucleotide-binding protein